MQCGVYQEGTRDGDGCADDRRQPGEDSDRWGESYVNRLKQGLYSVSD